MPNINDWVKRHYKIDKDGIAYLSVGWVSVNP